MDKCEDRNKNMEIKISSEVKEMFDVALGIKKQTAETVLQRMMCNYVSNIFGELSKNFQGDINYFNATKINKSGNLKVRAGYFTKVELMLNSYVIKMFHIALDIKEESDGEVIERMMGTYVANTFEEVSKRYQDEVDVNEILKIDEENKYFLKAINKIPKWSLNREQVPFKIIRAFLKLQSEKNIVYYEDLMSLCTDSNYPDTYVVQFVANFNQLKYDTARSYGKVFVVDKENNIVEIWDEVKEHILKYQDRFYVGLTE